MNQSMPVRILVLGGGYVGLYTALGLQRRLKADEASVTVVDVQPHMTYQPFLPEAAAGTIAPRHVVVPLRRVLRRCRVLAARVLSIEYVTHSVTVETAAGKVERVPFDILVVALGAVTRVLPVPGLAGVGVGFKNLGDAMYLRNHVLGKLHEADGPISPDVRRRKLTFVVVGGGFAGVEVLAELEDMTRFACRYYETVRPSDLRWVLVEAAPRILPEVQADLGVWTVEQLRQRGVRVFLTTTGTSFEGGRVRLSDGTEFDTETVIWAAGMKPSPVLAASDLPLDRLGRVRVEPDLRVVGCPAAWSAGDNAAIPDLTRVHCDPGATCPPNAQHAVRQARHLAGNIVKVLRGRRPTPYRHRNLGAVAGLGLHKGVADIAGIKLKGFPAWVIHRGYHLRAMPTANRKARVLCDWMLAGLFRREIVSFGSTTDPRASAEAAGKRRSQAVE